MRKLASPHFDRHASPTRPWGRQIFALVLGLLMLPLLYDGAKLVYVEWASLYGGVPPVQTPALDLVQIYLDEASRLLRQAARYPFRQVPWKTEFAVGILVFSLITGVVVMRHHRLK